MKKYHIVWNKSRTEGFITDDEDDAEYASSGMRCGVGVSCIAEAMRETYCDDDEDEELPAQTIELEIKP